MPIKKPKLPTRAACMATLQRTRAFTILNVFAFR